MTRTLPPFSQLLPWLSGLAPLGLAAWAWLGKRGENSQPGSNGAQGEPEEAVPAIYIARGGRVSSLNRPARELFGLGERERPNLERLARLTRPETTFLDLCQAPGSGRLAVQGRLYEAASFVIPDPTEKKHGTGLLAVVLHAQADAEGLAVRSLDQLKRLNEAIAGTTDQESTLRVLWTSLRQLFPVDWIQIHLWNDATGTLTPFRPEAPNPAQPQSAGWKMGEGLPGMLAARRKPLLVSDFLEPPAGDIGVHPAPGIRAYLGLPMLVGDDVVGCLELGSGTPGVFKTSDLVLLEMLATHTAFTLRSTQRFQAEQHRADELSGLAEMVQTFSTLKDADGLISRLVDVAAPLLPVELFGFWLYREPTRTLEAQFPFRGIPPQYLQAGEWFRCPIPAGSVAEEILLTQDVLITDDAAADPQWHNLGLAAFAQTVGLRSCALVPLTAGSRLLGYLMAGNHRDLVNHFSRQDLRQLLLVAHQAAPLVENAALAQSSAHRTGRTVVLEQIANLVSSSLPLDDVFHQAVALLVDFLNADLAMAFLLDHASGTLQLHAPSLHGAPAGWDDRPRRMLVEDPQFPFTTTGSMRPFFSWKLRDEPDVQPFFRPWLIDSGMQSAVAVPLVAHDQSVGELWLCSRLEHAFDPMDQSMLQTAGSQLAGVVERSVILAQTDESLRRRVDQLTALSRITHELSVSLDLKYLLQIVYDEALRATNADCGTILLLDLEEADRVAFHVGDEHPGGLDAWEQQVIASGGPLCLSNLEEPPHPGVVSALLAPIPYREKTAGLIYLHSATPNRFDDAAVEFTQTLAMQASVMFRNAFQYQEEMRRGELLNRQVETLARVIQTTSSLRIDQPLEQALERIAHGITRATPFQMVLVSLYRPDTGLMERFCHVGVPPSKWAELRARPQPWASLSKLLKEEFRVLRSYFIPIENEPTIPTDVHLVTVQPTGEVRANRDAWDPDDMLLIPLTGVGGQPLGLMSVDAPKDLRRPDRPTYEALDIFATQASLVIQNYNTMTQVQEQLDHLKADQLRLQQSAHSAQAALPLLLQKDLEQTVALYEMHQRAAWTQQALEQLERIDRCETRADVFQALGSGLQEALGMDLTLLAERVDGEPALVNWWGAVPGGVYPPALFGRPNPLAECFAAPDQAPTAFLGDVSATPGWRSSELLQALDVRSCLCLVLEQGASAMLVGAHAPRPEPTPEVHAICRLLARQAEAVLARLGDA